MQPNDQSDGFISFGVFVDELLVEPDDKVVYTGKLFGRDLTYSSWIKRMGA